MQQGLQEEELEKFNTPIEDDEEETAGGFSQKKPNSLTQIFQVFQKKNADAQKQSSFALLNQSETFENFNDDEDEQSNENEGPSDDENEVLTTNYWKSKEMKERLEKRSWKNFFIPRKEKITIFLLLTLTCFMCFFVLGVFLMLFSKMFFSAPNSDSSDRLVLTAQWLPTLLEKNLNENLNEISEKGQSGMMIFNLQDPEIVPFFENITQKEAKRMFVFEKLNDSKITTSFHPIRAEPYFKSEKTKESYILNFVKGNLPVIDDIFVKKNWFSDYFTLNYNKNTKKFSFSEAESIKLKSFENFWNTANLTPSQSVFEKEKVKKIFFWRVINAIQNLNPVKVFEDEMHVNPVQFSGDKLMSFIPLESKKLKEVFESKKAFISCTKLNGKSLLNLISFCADPFSAEISKCPSTLESHFSNEQSNCLDETTVYLPIFALPKKR